MNGVRDFKRKAIANFFDDVDARVDFLGELARTGHEPEAMTLCVTYIDSFAQWLLWPATSKGRNFVEAMVLLSQTVHEGAPVPPIELRQLLGCVRRLVSEARRRSVEAGEWFGNDTIVKGAWPRFRLDCQL